MLLYIATFGIWSPLATTTFLGTRTDCKFKSITVAESMKLCVKPESRKAKNFLPLIDSWTCFAWLVIILVMACKNIWIFWSFKSRNWLLPGVKNNTWNFCARGIADSKLWGWCRWMSIYNTGWNPAASNITSWALERVGILFTVKLNWLVYVCRSSDCTVLLRSPK